MLYLYTQKPAEDVYVHDVESYFYLKYASIYKHPIALQWIKEIDGALRTKFGITVPLNISSGSKALLIAITQTDCVVNFIEAGQNILDKVIELADKYDLHIYTDNNVLLISRRGYKEIKVTFDDVFTLESSMHDGVCYFTTKSVF